MASLGGEARALAGADHISLMVSAGSALQGPGAHGCRPAERGAPPTASPRFRDSLPPPDVRHPRFSLTPHTLESLDGCPNLLCTPRMRPALPPFLGNKGRIVNHCSKPEAQPDFTGFHDGAGRERPLARTAGDLGAKGEESSSEPPSAGGLLASVHRNPERAPSRSRVQTWACHSMAPDMQPPTAHVFSAPSVAWGTLTVPWAPWPCPADLAAWAWGVGESLPPRDRHTVSLSSWQVPLDLAGLPRAVVGELCRGQGPGTHPRWKLLNSPACPGWPRPCRLLCQKAAGSEHPGLQGASGIPARSL